MSQMDDKVSELKRRKLDRDKEIVNLMAKNELRKQETINSNISSPLIPKHRRHHSSDLALKRNQSKFSKLKLAPVTPSP